MSELSGHGRVLAARRQQLIVERVQRDGSVRVSEVSAWLEVSEMTVRRDLDALAMAGLLVKVHGGATTAGEVPQNSFEPGFEEKSGRQTLEKAAIAAAAAELVRPGTAIGVSAGTTTWHFASAIREVENLIIVTNSVHVADVLHAAEGVERSVILTGGQRTPSDALVGPLAAHALDGLHLDQVFMGVHGMSPRAGFSTPNLLEAEINRSFVRAADRLIVLADHTKWRIVGLATFARLPEADVLVTDSALPEDAYDTLSTSVRRVLAV
jgi:DeoR/GlpR family transcriptional regulator of sugar metabolism